MEERFDALEVIANTRGKVNMDALPSGEKLFPLWGWTAAFFYMLEFVLWQFLHQEWIIWLWVGIPAVGSPLMSLILRKDHQRTHMRTHEAKLVLDYWIFAGCAICIGGFVFGFTGLYEMVENPMICLLVGIGAFVTGEAIRFRAMTAGGIIGAAIGICAFLLQGDLFGWQMLAIVIVAISSLIIPGHLYKRSTTNGAE